MPWSVGSCLNFFFFWHQAVPKSTSCSHLVSTLLIFKTIFCSAHEYFLQSIKSRGAIATYKIICLTTKSVILHCIAILICIEYIALLCRSEVQLFSAIELKQILDFSLGCKARCSAIEITAGIEQKLMTGDALTRRKPSQFWHYYETYLSCFDYKNIYWIVRLFFQTEYFIM